MSNLYNHREAQNDQQFDSLASKLQQFRSVVESDIHGGVAQEQLVLDLLNDGFGQLWSKVAHSSSHLRSVLARNGNVSRTVVVLLVAFIVLYTLYKLL